VKNLLLHRDTKAYLGWSSQRNADLKPESGSSTPTASIQTQLLRYNYSSDPAQVKSPLLCTVCVDVSANSLSNGLAGCCEGRTGESFGWHSDLVDGALLGTR
jgi:hypothetical protein